MDTSDRRHLGPRPAKRAHQEGFRLACEGMDAKEQHMRMRVVRCKLDCLSALSCHPHVRLILLIFIKWNYINHGPSTSHVDQEELLLVWLCPSEFLRLASVAFGSKACLENIFFVCLCTDMACLRLEFVSVSCRPHNHTFMHP